MPDTRKHRGLDPADDELFGPETLSGLRQATGDLCWLLSRGYALKSAVELVGNRYSLAARQRMAVARSACSDLARHGRACREVMPSGLRGQEIWIDGLNVLTGLEVALSGGIVLVGCDGCCRDIAGVHRHYRKVEETLPALRLLGACLAQWGVRKCQWWLDKPVSNSGRLKTFLLSLAHESGWDWEAELVFSPDAVLAKTGHVVATSDSVILDRCQRWLNLVRAIVRKSLPQTRLVDLSCAGVGATSCVPGTLEQQ